MTNKLPSKNNELVIKPKILVVDYFYPTHDRDAGSLTTFNTLLLLKQMGWSVSFLAHKSFSGEDRYKQDLISCGVNVISIPFWMRAKYFFKHLSKNYDVALLFRPLVAKQYIKILRESYPNIKIIYHAVDLHFLRMQRESEIKKNRSNFKNIDRIRKIEFEAFIKSDATIVHSTFESELISSTLPNINIHIWPLILNMQFNSRGCQSRSGLAFVGNYKHSPNLDAVNYFLKDIFPLILENIPDIVFHIIGSDMPSELKNISSKNVNVVGFIDNLEEYLMGMRISISPLRYGAGVKGKIGLSMATGTPVVASSLSVEGMDIIGEGTIIVADSPQVFSDRVIELYKNDKLWEKMHSNCLNFASKNWGFPRAQEHLAAIFKSIEVNYIQGR